jgi:hypothetical protein
MSLLSDPHPHVDELVERERELAVLEAAETLAKLSSILWCPGRGEEARLTARQAVELLPGMPAGCELALAYANYSGGQGADGGLAAFAPPSQ